MRIAASRLVSSLKFRRATRLFALQRSVGGATAGAEFKLSGREVLLELSPLCIGGFPVLDGGGAHRSTVVEVTAVGPDQLILENRDVPLRGGDVGVSEELGGDVDRESARNRVRGEQSPEVVRCEVQRLAGRVTKADALDRLFEKASQGSVPDH